MKWLPPSSSRPRSAALKAPDNNILELALCKKAILVEGDAEFILMDALYKNTAKAASTDSDGVHVISVDGTSFKRYFEAGQIRSA